MGVRCDKPLIGPKLIDDPGPNAVIVGSAAWRCDPVVKQ